MPISAAVLLAGAAWTAWGPRGTSRVSEGLAAPAFRLARLDGTAFDSGTLRGQLVVLNFWATWCAPCIEELPSLERLHGALSTQGLQVVAVAADDDIETLRGFVARQRLTFTVLHDPGGAAAAAWGVEGWPTTFVIDPRGLVQGVYVGPADWGTPEALAYFRKLLGPRAAPGQRRSTLHSRMHIFVIVNIMRVFEKEER